MELFSKEEVNTGRQWGVDFSKLLAIVFMVLVHTFIYEYGEENMNEGFQYRLNNIYGGVLAAPIFMFAMGVGIAYSRNNDARTMFGRGIKLIIVGYLLNLVRCLPRLLLWKGGFGEEHYGLFVEEVNLFDILQFSFCSAYCVVCALLPMSFCLLVWHCQSSAPLYALSKWAVQRSTCCAIPS